MKHDGFVFAMVFATTFGGQHPDVSDSCLPAFVRHMQKLGLPAGYDWKSFRLLITFFWHRLLGTGGIWFFNDWYFYGNGVFRSTFVGLLVGSNASVQVNWLYSYINSGVQVCLLSFRAYGNYKHSLWTSQSSMSMSMSMSRVVLSHAKSKTHAKCAVTAARLLGQSGCIDHSLSLFVL